MYSTEYTNLEPVDYIPQGNFVVCFYTTPTTKSKKQVKSIMQTLGLRPWACKLACTVEQTGEYNIYLFFLSTCVLAIFFMAHFFAFWTPEMDSLTPKTWEKSPNNIDLVRGLKKPKALLVF